jgi:ribosomal protein S27AE
MKKKFHATALMMLFSFAGFGVASVMADHPDEIVYQAKNGNVTFNHATHAERLECGKCHQQDPPEKIEINREAAHGPACQDCHKQMQGPVKCAECHVK